MAAEELPEHPNSQLRQKLEIIPLFLLPGKTDVQKGNSVKKKNPEKSCSKLE